MTMSKKDIRTAAANKTLTAAAADLLTAVNVYNDKRAQEGVTADLLTAADRANDAASVYNRRAAVEAYASFETAADLVKAYAYEGKTVKLDRAHSAAAVIEGKTLYFSLTDYIRTAAENGKLTAADRRAAAAALDLVCLGVHEALESAAAVDADGVTASRDSVRYDVTTVKQGLLDLCTALSISRLACPVNAKVAADLIHSARLDRKSCEVGEAGKNSTAAAVLTVLHGVTVKAAGKAAARAAARRA